MIYVVRNIYAVHIFADKAQLFFVAKKRYSEETLVNASIEGIIPNGDIHISCHGMEKTIRYSSIKYIKDFYDNTQNLVLAKRSGKKASAVVVKKNIRAMMREYS